MCPDPLYPIYSPVRLACVVGGAGECDISATIVFEIVNNVCVYKEKGGIV